MNALTIPLFASCLLVGGVSFVDPAPTLQDPAPAQDPQWVLKAGAHEAKALADGYARFLGRNVLYDENTFAVGASSEIELQQPMTLTADNCESVIENLLFSRNLVLVPTNPDQGIYELVSMHGPKRVLIPQHALSMPVAKVLANRHRKMTVQCTVPLQHVQPAMITTTLRPMMAANGAMGTTLGMVPKGVILSGFADQVAKAIDVIVEVDVPAEGDPAKASPAPSVRLQLEELRAAVDALTKRVERLEGK